MSENVENKSYKQNDRVYFNLGQEKLKGYGIVNGKLGPIIILKLETPIDSYPYTHIYVVDTQITDPPN